MHEDGLNFRLSLQSINVGRDQEKTEKELYQVGFWIDHETNLLIGENKEPLVLRHLEGLSGDIMEVIDGEYKPKLGGNYQDKICAGMLFNNDFGKVQQRENLRDLAYYPWMVVASAEKDNPHLDFELPPQNTGLRKGQKLNKEEILNAYPHKRGFSKKYMYLWKGAEIYTIKKSKNQKSIHKNIKSQFEWENISRFRFVHVPSAYDKNFEEVKKQGVIRVLRGDISNEVVATYCIWLKQWLKTDTIHVIDLFEGETEIGGIFYEKGQVYFCSYKDLEDKANIVANRYIELLEEKNIIRQQLVMAHGGYITENKNICNYRSHGTVIQQIFNVKKSVSDTELIEPLNLCELFEVLCTKVCVFDNRIYDRLPTQKRDFYKNTLLLEARQEEETEWAAIKRIGFTNYHFLVVHLSFIEKIYNKKYSEHNIQQFVEEEILNGRPIEELEKNFVLVITTGRGRIEWWNNLAKTNLIRFTTFRPIESLLTAVEDAMLKNDEIDLKYNLVKVLFGS